jgi:hypothetical protein
MPHDVFISYSHKDKPIADAICANLESAGFRCWIAPRDIAPGQDWPTAISEAITLSRVMVLVFSADSNRSKQVGNEISLAFDNNLIIIPFKLDAIAPEPGKQYYLARTHWLDAMNPPTQEQIDKLVGYVRSFVPEQGSAGMALPMPVNKAPVVEALQPAPEVKHFPSQPVNVEPSGLQKEPKRKNIWIWGILLLAAIITGSFFAVRSFGSDPLPTSTPTSSFTSTLTSTIPSTPTPSRTSTPRPTSTQTPQPAWVTDFAQPILDAILSRSPNFQDDFHDKSGGWQAADWCGKRMEYMAGEMVVTDCRLSNPHINYSDFVAEFDARFLPGAGRDTEWIFHFRETEGPNYEIRINYPGDVHLFFYQGNNYEFPGVANPGDQSNHVVVIAKGDRTAYYINSEPLSYVEISTIRYGGLRFLADNTILAIDNFKVWNISDLP